MTTRYYLFAVIVLIFCSELAHGQAETIQLSNPSFEEDYPRAERVPLGWTDCGFVGETPPDTHPSGAFGVRRVPHEGKSYLGMVVRDNDTWERVSQPLSTPMKSGTCYSFSLNLCRSELYISASKTSLSNVNYTKPIKLIIWGGDGTCSKKERLAISPTISNTQWKPYIFKFEPKQTHTHITLEAFYKDIPVLNLYNGNVLVDKASDIIPIPCDEEPILAQKPELEFMAPNDRPIEVDNPKYAINAKIINSSEKINIVFRVNGNPSTDFNYSPATGIVTGNIRQLKEGNNRIVFEAINDSGKTEDSAILIYNPKKILALNEAPAPPPATYEKPSPKIIETSPNKKDTKIEGYSRKEITEGQIIKISELSFKINDSTLNQSAFSRLDNIYEFLKDNNEVIIEIGGHTSGLCDASFCNQLSTARAKEVALYLQNKGIPKHQLNYKGYGKTKPIASNNTTGGRRKNQRVEIKILSTDG